VNSLRKAAVLALTSDLDYLLPTLRVNQNCRTTKRDQIKPTRAPFEHHQAPANPSQ
jgi:hypothetical protein